MFCSVATALVSHQYGSGSISGVATWKCVRSPGRSGVCPSNISVSFHRKTTETPRTKPAREFFEKVLKLNFSRFEKEMLFKIHHPKESSH